MTIIRDVIVVGAGPAGATTAKYAAKNGADTLILESKDHVGAPIQCGELMAEPEEMWPVMGRHYDYEEFLAIPESVKLHMTDAIRISGPGAGPYEFPFHGYTTDRPVFDPALADMAVKAGAELGDFHGFNEDELDKRKSDDMQIAKRLILGIRNFQGI